MTLDDWIRSHRFLEPLAHVRHRIDAAVEQSATVLPIPGWDEYVEDFVDGVPLLRSQSPIDLDPAGQAIIAVIRSLASDAADPALAQDAAALSDQLRQDRLAAHHILHWLLGDDTWEPVRGGLLRSVGWITMSAALRPLVLAFAEWRDDDRWLRRYCPTCGALPTMAHLVGVDPGRRRFLACGRCASQWRYGRTGCPFCETESHRLASFAVEDEGGLRIDYCETCRGYLKTYSGEGNERVLLADWTSLHLDLVARDRGLKRLATSLYDFEPRVEDAPTPLRTASADADSGPSGNTATFH